MLKKLPSQPQLEMFKTVLASFINPQHELCLLAKKIDWDSLEKEFAVWRSRQAFHSNQGHSWATAVETDI